MTERLTPDEARRFWTDQVVRHGQSPAASWSDVRVIELEVAELARRIGDGERVLDVGCANGYTTVEIASRRRVRIKGIDYIPEMVAQAELRKAPLAPEIRSRLDFAVGDATALPDGDAAFDTVVSVRVLINLGPWERQAEALRECVRVLRPGGRLLLSEATVEGWDGVNALRREWGLPDIPMPPFNNYLHQGRVESELSATCRLEERCAFASTYYVGTRLLKPLLARALRSDIDVANPLSEWNRLFAQLPPWGGYGTQQLLVFRKQ